MRLTTSLSISLIFGIFLISCGKKSSEPVEFETSNLESPVRLIKNGQLILEIDSVTPADVTAYAHLPDDNAILIMNIFTNSLYKYSLETGDLLSIDAYPVEGTNAVGEFKNTTELYVQGDSIIFHDRNSQNLIIVDSEKRIIHKTNFRKNYVQVPYGMWSNWINPYKDGYSLSAALIYYAFDIIPNSVDSTEFFYNPKTEELSRLYLPIPDVYKGKRWLAEVMRYYREYNPKTNDYVYSWPISDSLFVKDQLGNVRGYYMGAESYKKNVPLPDRWRPVVADLKRKLDYYYEQGKYSYLYYDQSRDLLFRFAFSGIKTGRVDINDPFGDTDLFDQTLVIGDGKYNKIGEFNADGYVSSVALFTEKGILLLKEVEDEDYLVFDRFKLGNNE